MSVKMESNALRAWRDEQIANHLSSNDNLNFFHERVMRKAFEMSLQRVEGELGPLPVQFSWFLMGSCGRFEQAIFSDQDHGIVYEESNEEVGEYFHCLGKEVTEVLYELGYPYCDGKIMSSNKMWNKSIDEWKVQIHQWFTDESWESIRYLLIFFDGRTVYGEDALMGQLKAYFLDCIKEHPNVLKRFSENTKRLIKGVGLFGNFLTKNDGEYTGYLDLKQTSFLPYVNNIRLLSMKEGISTTSTISRLSELQQRENYRDFERYETNFRQLLQYRLLFSEEHQKYDDVHFLRLDGLDRQQRSQLKRILKDVEKLHHFTHSLF